MEYLYKKFRSGEDCVVHIHNIYKLEKLLVMQICKRYIFLQEKLSWTMKLMKATIF